MNSVLETYVSRIDLGEPQRCKNIIVVPVFMTGNHSPEYLTLTEALGKKLASITEVSAAGTVPEVKVFNNSDLFLLLVDGEELVGARQNRTLNASILLAGRSGTIIPASCTERGRWDYQGGKTAFGDAGFVSPHKLRSFTSRSVSESLMRGLGHKSDQTGVWHHVALCGMSAGASSQTSAMADVVTKMARELEECLQQLEALPGQQGLAVLVNGIVVGVDLLSSARACQVLHPNWSAATLWARYWIKSHSACTSLASRWRLSWKRSGAPTSKFTGQSAAGRIIGLWGRASPAPH